MDPKVDVGSTSEERGLFQDTVLNVVTVAHQQEQRPEIRRPEPVNLNEAPLRGI